MNIDPLYKNIAKKIKRIRKSKHLTQKEIAEKAGISESYFGKIERANANVRILTFRKIARVLDIEPYELLKFDKD